MKETWKPVVGFEDRYKVSNFGRVKNYKRRLVLKQRLSVWGYPVVCLWDGSKKHTMVVHRMVAKAFIKNPENRSDVNHKDCNKTNNFVKNLEWCTPLENSQHAVKNGKLDHFLGENHRNNKLTIQQVKDIKNEYAAGKTTHRKLAAKYGVAKNSISNILNGRAWKRV